GGRVERRPRGRRSRDGSRRQGDGHVPRRLRRGQGRPPGVPPLVSALEGRPRSMGSLVAFLTSDGGLRGGGGPADAAQSAERKFKMAHLEESIEVAVPVRTAYNQWTQFEEFPKFMEGVKSVRQISDNLLTW